MAEPVKAGDPVIDFKLADLSGTEHNSALARSTGLLLYAIYKKGCATCQYTMPFLQRFEDRYAGAGFQVWGISQDSPAETGEFASNYSILFPLLMDDGLKVTGEHRLISVPAIYLVDGTDQILASAHAFDSASLNAMADLIADRTGRPQSPLVAPEDNAPAFKPG